MVPMGNIKRKNEEWGQLEKTLQIEIWDFFDEWSNCLFLVIPPPMKKTRKSKNVIRLIYMNAQNNIFDSSCSTQGI